MAAPVTKRRKLRHDSEDGSASEGENGPALGTSVREDSRKFTPKPDQAKQVHKRQDAPLQDGVYTSEVYKSNMFKLQVDELLPQVKFKYGKKVASVENAMRSLKSIIEQIPSRDAAPVCSLPSVYTHVSDSP
jgi:U3 small nucleolar RNA-associated protein 22